MKEDIGTMPFDMIMEEIARLPSATERIDKIISEHDGRIYGDIHPLYYIAECRGFVNIGIDSIQQFFSEPGTVHITVGKGKGKHRITQALECAMKHLPRDRESICSILAYLSTDNHDIKMEEVQEFSDWLRSCGDDVQIAWGIGVNNNLLQNGAEAILSVLQK